MANYLNVVFPSRSLHYSDRGRLSRAAAKQFGESVGLDAPVKFGPHVYGYRLPLSLGRGIFEHAAASGGELMSVTESAVWDGSSSAGMPQGSTAPKNKHDGKRVGGDSKTKVSGSHSFASLKKLEGQWIDTTDNVNAARIKLEGDAAIGRDDTQIPKGRYFVLGITEARDNLVVTLGVTSKRSDLGRTSRGRYVYNVRGDELAEAASMVSKDKGGVIGSTGNTKAAKAALTKDDIGKVKTLDKMGAKVTAESQQTRHRSTRSGEPERMDSLVHRVLGAMRGMQSPAAPRAAKTGGMVSNLIESASAIRAPKMAQPSAKPAAAEMSSIMESGSELQAMLSGAAEQFTQKDAMSLFAPGARFQLPPVEESEDEPTEDAYDGLDELSNDELEELAAEMGIDVPDDDEEVEESDDEPPVDADDTEEDDDEDEEDEEDFAEEMEPGDVSSTSTLTSALSKRGVMNADKVASHLAAGDPANEWFDIAGIDLQSAKELAWDYDRLSNGG